MPRPKLVSDEQIIDVARKCFLKQGAMVSTTVIADELGISQAVIFKRFGTKEQLLLKAMSPPEIPPWIEELKGGPISETAMKYRGQLLAVTKIIWGFIQDVTPRMMILRASGMDPHELMGKYKVPPPVHGQRAMAAWFTRANDLGLTQIRNPEDVAIAFLGMLHSRALFFHFMGVVSTKKVTDRYLESVVDLMLYGTVNGKITGKIRGNQK